MSQFQTAEPEATAASSTSAVAADDDSDDSASDLPYPAPLLRSDFVTAPGAPPFSATAYLSKLAAHHGRHQTLADLRAELRARSALIGRELLDLVNANYANFLSLGTALHGGEDAVEQVRLELLGLRAAFAEIRKALADREAEVAQLVAEREMLCRQRSAARSLLEVERRLRELEAALMVDRREPGGRGGHEESVASDSYWEEDEEDEEDDEASAADECGVGSGLSVSRLTRLARLYLSIRQLGKRAGERHPFLLALEPRLIKVRHSLLLDLGAELKMAQTAGSRDKSATLKIMNIYLELDEGSEAVRVLKARS